MEKRQSGKWNWFEYRYIVNCFPVFFFLCVPLCSLPFLKQSKCLLGPAYQVQWHASLVGDGS